MLGAPATPRRPSPSKLMATAARRSPAGTGSRFSAAAFRTVKIAALTPTARALVARPGEGSHQAQHRCADSFHLLSSVRREKPRQDGRRPFPLARFFFDLLAAGAGEPIELGAAVVLGYAPVRRDVAFLLELEQGRIDGAVIDAQPIAAGRL